MSVQYDFYLKQHKHAVSAAFDWIKEFAPQILKDLDTNIDWQIYYNHDASKMMKEEYQAYDDYFYGGSKSHAVVSDFNYAWLHHIHHNPHHWQHWVLMEDDGKEPYKALEMPIEFVIEMLCDWWSFSFRAGDLREIFNWYDQHKDKMILHEKTRETVEWMLSEIKTTLEECDALLSEYSGEYSEEREDE